MSLFLSALALFSSSIFAQSESRQAFMNKHKNAVQKQRPYENGVVADEKPVLVSITDEPGLVVALNPIANTVEMMDQKDQILPFELPKIYRPAVYTRVLYPGMHPTISRDIQAGELTMRITQKLVVLNGEQGTVLRNHSSKTILGSITAEIKSIAANVLSVELTDSHAVPVELYTGADYTPFELYKNLKDCLQLKDERVRCTEVATNKEVLLYFDVHQLSPNPYVEDSIELFSADRKYFFPYRTFRFEVTKKHSVQNAVLPDSIKGKIQSFYADLHSNQLIVQLDTGKSFVFTISLFKGKTYVKFKGPLTNFAVEPIAINKQHNGIAAACITALKGVFSLFN